MQTQLNFESKRTMHANSLASYYNEVEPTLKGRKLEVYEAIKKLGKATLRDIAEFLNKPVHSISGRPGELKKMGLIKELDQVKINNTNHTLWAVV